MTDFTINWAIHTQQGLDKQFRNQPCEVKVTRAATSKQLVNVYLVLPVGPTRKRQAYNRVLGVVWKHDWAVLTEQEHVIRSIIDLIPMRLGVQVTAINWWGYKRKEVLNATDDQNNSSG